MTTKTVGRNPEQAERDPQFDRLVEAFRAVMQAEARNAVQPLFDEVREKMEEMRESVRWATGIDPARIEWRHPRLSFKSLKAAMYKMARTGRLREAYPGVPRRLVEANAETAFGQLLRYGVQHYLFDAYQQITTVMEAVFEQRPSSNLLEWYAPLYGAEVPEDVDSGGRFNDSRIRGLDVTVRNKKVGRILSIERELVDDDQTGQIVQRASRMGERMRYKEELDAVVAWVNARDHSTGTPAAGYSASLGNHGGNVALSQRALELAAIALRKMKDPLGNFFLVQPDVVVAGVDEEINLYKLLNSIYQPAVPGAPGETAGTAAAGLTGWTLTANWLQGRFKPVISTFFSHPTIGGDAYWYVAQAKQGAVMQNRDPLEVIQENPLSGAAFETDAYRYRTRRRYKHAVVEPRYIYQGKGAQ